jgi:hypothetical protein
MVEESEHWERRVSGMSVNGEAADALYMYKRWSQ